MHIGFLTPEYPHPRVTSSAGIGTSIRNLAMALSAKGVAVSIFVYGQNEDAVFSEKNIKIHLIRQQRFRMFGWYLHRKYLQNYLDKYIAVDGIQAIEAPDWTGITAFMKLRCPIVIRMHGSDAYFCHLEGRLQKKKNFWFEKMALTGADYLVSVSHFTAGKTAEIFQLKKETVVIPNAVDVRYFQPTGNEGNSRKILYFGSIIRKKGVLELASIFNRIVECEPNVILQLVGKDVTDILEERSTLEIFVQKLSPLARSKFVHIPRVDYEKVKDHLASASVVVLPSFAEALPMTWLEAMAMEKAVVASNIGWAGEVMLDGETGYTVDPRNHLLYAEKVINLLNDCDLRDRFGMAARKQVVENFSTTVVVPKNISLYEKLVRQ